MKRNIQPFWNTYGISKHEKLKQTKTHIYIYIYISPQNISTGRTAKKCASQEKKKYMRMSTDMLYKAKERIILRVPDSPNNTRNIGIHPYTAYFGGFWSKFLSLLVAF